jgi:hypothetical protein
MTLAEITGIDKKLVLPVTRLRLPEMLLDDRPYRLPPDFLFLEMQDVVVTVCNQRMTIFITADLHYREHWFRWLLDRAADYDLLCIVGDLLDMFYREPRWHRPGRSVDGFASWRR